MSDPIDDPDASAALRDGDGASAGALTLAGRAAIADACLRLAREARRELLILSRHLDPELYDRLPFLKEVQRVCLATPHQPLRVLVAEPRVPATGGHRLIGLARRLPSRIGIRRTGEDFRDRLDAFLIADGRGYCLRRLADRPEALVDYAAPGEAGRLRAEFEQIWEQSDGDTELRRLDL